jgi:hypothetical protein
MFPFFVFVRITISYTFRGVTNFFCSSKLKVQKTLGTIPLSCSVGSVEGPKNEMKVKRLVCFVHFQFFKFCLFLRISTVQSNGG